MLHSGRGARWADGRRTNSEEADGVRRSAMPQVCSKILHLFKTFEQHLSVVLTLKYGHSYDTLHSASTRSKA